MFIGKLVMKINNKIRYASVSIFLICITACTSLVTFVAPNTNIYDYQVSNLKEAAMQIGSSIECGYIISVSNIDYFILTDSAGNIKYIRTWSKKFRTPEMYSAKTDGKNIRKQDIKDIYVLHSIGKTVVKLKSGWKLLFGTEDKSIDGEKSLYAYYGDDL